MVGLCNIWLYGIHKTDCVEDTVEVQKLLER